ncbi:uncharacterized protein MELLADRAFT_79358 [Melampsora larici-populina 98AG31]|uniref:Uncharacterized protein n=1 Tax=Melampsora larici-populina (strain 98AG31 / pathotype 3-4-7) TaxID=747676 RepID=F4S5W4_MELLP|nr:uncharacterized protein MELLADRAFT_79358 [Melampsora larici-populina 98AG31]EGF99970.1 hypothetical protein MELLADRAFT_79358 [Melampsora larici-populina 98AG31]
MPNLRKRRNDSTTQQVESRTATASVSTRSTRAKNRIPVTSELAPPAKRSKRTQASQNPTSIDPPSPSQQIEDVLPDLTLAARLAPPDQDDSTRPTQDASQRQDNSTRSTQPRLATLPDRNDPTFPTIHNYKEHLLRWPQGKIRKYLSVHRSELSNRPSQAIQTELKLAYQTFEHTLLMIAMVGNISEKTMRKQVPESRNKRRKGGYSIYRRFGKKPLSESMSEPGQKDGVLSLRNKRNGCRWSSLDKDSKDVFKPKIFFALAGLPIPRDYIDKKKLDLTTGDIHQSGDHSPPIPAISAEDEALYRPIYEELVDESKVLTLLKPKAMGATVAKTQRRAQKMLKEIAGDLAHERKDCNMAYYLLGVSTEMPGKGKGTPWSVEYSSHPQVGTWANDQYGFRRVFAAYAQGASMGEAIVSSNKDTLGTCTRTKLTAGTSGGQSCDRVKGRLSHLLRLLITKANGSTPPQSFPQTANPQQSLYRRNLDFDIVQLEGSQLSKEALEKGFRGMTTQDRRNWITDLEQALFCLRKDPYSENVGLTPSDIVEEADKDASPTGKQITKPKSSATKGAGIQDEEDEEDDEEDDDNEEEENDDDDEDDDDDDDDEEDNDNDDDDDEDNDDDEDDQDQSNGQG